MLPAGLTKIEAPTDMVSGLSGAPSRMALLISPRHVPSRLSTS